MTQRLLSSRRPFHEYPTILFYEYSIILKPLSRIRPVRRPPLGAEELAELRAVVVLRRSQTITCTTELGLSFGEASLARSAIDAIDCSDCSNSAGMTKRVATCVLAPQPKQGSSSPRCLDTISVATCSNAVRAAPPVKHMGCRMARMCSPEPCSRIQPRFSRARCR